jgi:hypothetical protein
MIITLNIGAMIIQIGINEGINDVMRKTNAIYEMI